MPSDLVIISVNVPVKVAEFLRDEARREFRSVRAQAAAVLAEHVREIERAEHRDLTTSDEPKLKAAEVNL